MRRLMDRLPITFTPYALLYPILLLAAFLFAQGVKLPITHTLFVFVLLMPLGTVFQLIMARLTVKTTFRVSSQTPRKRSPLLANAIIKNKGLLPYSLIEASLTLPDKKGEKLKDCRFVFSLMPFSSCSIDRSIEFAFRGEWQIGVNCIYVYDFMRTVRLRIPVKCQTDILVIPRMLTLEETNLDSQGKRTSPKALHSRGCDNTDIEDIRAYRPGDSRKSIHWKLSTKSEDLIVKEFTDNSILASVILCSTESFGFANSASDQPRKLKAEYEDTADAHSTDLAIEIALAIIRRELEKKSEVTLALFENGIPTILHIRDEAELDTHFRRIACASVSKSTEQFTALADAVGNRLCTSLILVGPVLDISHTADCLSAIYKLPSDTAPEFRLCTPECMFDDSPAENALTERIKELGNEGVDVFVTRNT